MCTYSQIFIWVRGIFTTSKNTSAVFLPFWFYNCEFDKIMTTYSHILSFMTKIHLKYFCQKHSGCIFASGKIGSTHLFVNIHNSMIIHTNIFQSISKYSSLIIFPFFKNSGSVC